MGRVSFDSKKIPIVSSLADSMRLTLIGLIKKRDTFEFQLHILRLISAVEAIDKDVRVADDFRDNPLDDPQPD